MKNKNITCDFTFDFKFEGQGEYQDGKILISPREHESMEEIYCTITHEAIHASMDYLNEYDNNSYMDHWVIRHMMWGEEYLD